jgi:hypothetical protein
MEQMGNIKVLFIAGFGPIVREASASRKLYNQILGIGFKEENGGYLHTEALKGAKSFALWPLSQAAQSCFSKDSWPLEVPAPQAWLEFDVDNVEKATEELESQGHRMLVKNKKEPWGQTVSRFITPEGLLVGILHSLDARRKIASAMPGSRMFWRRPGRIVAIPPMWTLLLALRKVPYGSGRRSRRLRGSQYQSPDGHDPRDGILWQPRLPMWVSSSPECLPLSPRPSADARLGPSTRFRSLPP